MILDFGHAIGMNERVFDLFSVKESGATATASETDRSTTPRTETCCTVGAKVFPGVRLMALKGTRVTPDT